DDDVALCPSPSPDEATSSWQLHPPNRVCARVPGSGPRFILISHPAPAAFPEVLTMKMQMKTHALEAAHESTATDVDLVSAAQSGDHMAFTELWRRYSKKM